MNVLVINGSPRANRGNTYQLTKSFLEGLKTGSDIVVEEIAVADLQIESCRGCFGCWWGKNPGQCVIQDEMAKVIEKIIWADTIIWSFPLYYFGVPGKMKTVIDRMLPTVMPTMDPEAPTGSHPTRYDFSNQKHILISTCGFFTAEGNYDSVELMFEHMYGKGNYETIFAGEGALFTIEQAKPLTDPYLADVKQAGVEYVQGSISEKTKAALSRVLWPREQYEGMVNGF